MILTYIGQKKSNMGILPYSSLIRIESGAMDDGFLGLSVSQIDVIPEKADVIP